MNEAILDPAERDILILDENTVNKIAAGEVIERPASVVKELVENAIDAHATKISVHVEDGGKKLITVKDNGSGMSEKNALLAVKKHATSKLSSIDDLDTLTTLGFRGEALPSICAVAKVELITRTAGGSGVDENATLEGTRLVIEGGETIRVETIGCDVGTSITVKELFYNVPARRKYLKSTRTELAHIVDFVTRQAIVRHDIYFRLVHNGNELLCAPPTRRLLDNIVNVYGSEFARELIPIDSERDGIKIKGYLGKPALTRTSPEYLSVYVNKRYIKSQLIVNAIREAYRKYIPKTKYPIAILLLEMSPKLIDVNVHPTKRTIKFAEERVLYDSLVNTLDMALGGSSLTPKVKVSTRTSAPPMPRGGRLTPISQAVGYTPRTVVGSGRSQITVERKLRKSMDIGKGPVPRATTDTLPSLNILGQLLNTYILAETPEQELLIIDQHAAHERVLYERTLHHYDESITRSQELITPKTLELSPKEQGIIDRYIPMLTELGFRLERFSGNTYNVRAVPVVMGELESIEIIHDILNDLFALGSMRNESEVKERLAQLIACKSAIKAGDSCTRSQLERLLAQLRTLENPYTCPHGRPTLVLITKKELEKKFKRI